MAVIGCKYPNDVRLRLTILYWYKTIMYVISISYDTIYALSAFAKTLKALDQSV